MVYEPRMKFMICREAVRLYMGGCFWLIEFLMESWTR